MKSTKLFSGFGYAKSSVALAAAACLWGATPASAWEVSTTIADLETSLFVGDSTGTFTWTTLSEGVRADSGLGSFTNNYTFQTWDGTTWPSALLDDAGPSEGSLFTEAFIEQDLTTDEFPLSAESFVSGNVAPGRANGAAWAYNFELVVDPSSSVTVNLDFGGSATGSIMSEIGDDGFAFSGIKLYSTDVGLNDFGGVNNPYAQDSIFLASPPTGILLDKDFSFFYDFDNLAGGTAATYTLRLEGSVSVFETAIPEPASLVLLSLSGLAIIARRRTQA